MATTDVALDVTAEIMRYYWQRVDRLIAAAQKAGMDLAVSSPRMVQDEKTLAYNMVWEHRFLEPGASEIDGHLGLTWVIYRCGGKT